jgi:GntR family transcriptional regulator
MRLWLSRNSEIPLREQLAAQIMLGVISHDLRAGDKLPAVRELARRHRIHSNTVDAAYRDLIRRGWLQSRRGSGVYVRDLAAQSQEKPVDHVDQAIATLLNLARREGISPDELSVRINRWLRAQPPRKLVVIEPEPELRDILIAEIREYVPVPVEGAGLESALEAGRGAVALYSRATEVRDVLPPNAECTFLKLRSVPGALSGQTRPKPHDLIAVISRSAEVLRWTRAVLVAAGIDPAALVIRDARNPSWGRGLEQFAFVIADVITAREMPSGSKTRLLRLISEDSLQQLAGM